MVEGRPGEAGTHLLRGDLAQAEGRAERDEAGDDRAVLQVDDLEPDERLVRAGGADAGDLAVADDDRLGALVGMSEVGQAVRAARPDALGVDEGEVSGEGRAAVVEEGGVVRVAARLLVDLGLVAPVGRLGRRLERGLEAGGELG